MAGIGFELRKFLAKNNYVGLLGAYGYAGIVTSGPWLLAIFSILILSIFSRLHHLPVLETHRFQIIIVYLIAGSLIFSSVFQHTYTRYIADECYRKREDQIIPSLNSIFLFILFFGGIIGGILIQVLLPNENSMLQLLVLSLFLTLSMVWVTTSVLSGLLAYKTIFSAFLANFLLIMILGYFLDGYGLNGLLLSFLCGQFLLLMVLIYVIDKSYPASELINFHFFKGNLTKKSLILTGLFYNVGIWIDKFMFWYDPLTGFPVIGKLHESIVYDTPIFLAYLAIVPGMTIFLLHMETDYEEAHEGLYKKINGTNTFAEIQHAYRKLLTAGQTALYSVMKAEMYVLIIGVTAASGIFIWFGISTVYIPLFCICLLAAGLNVIFWGALDIMFYLNKINHAIFVTFIFMISNTIFTWLSLRLGIFYFGYGLVASLLLTIILSFLLLNYELKNLQYETYMLQT